jgi:tRNA threonylcarbamoyladenosine biosynthesis protein TsaB
MSAAATALVPRAAGDGAAPLLAFDTSTERLAVAAAGPRGTCAINAAGGAAASTELMPQIHAALAAAGLVLADLAAIGFGRGPGAFTGLRTSCAVAQGLGFGLARPLLPLDSLLIVAEDAFGAATGDELDDELDDQLGDEVGRHPGDKRRGEPGAEGAEEAAARSDAGLVAVVMDARMDEVYGALYERRSAGAWSTRLAPALYTLAAWNSRVELHAHTLRGVAGSGLAVFGPRLHRMRGVPEVAAERDRARALLRLARAAWRSGAAIDAAQALPLYLRDKVALTTAERAAARGAAGITAPVATAPEDAGAHR